MPNFDIPTIQEIADIALDIVTLHSDMLVILGGIILAVLAMNWLIFRIRKPPI